MSDESSARGGSFVPRWGLFSAGGVVVALVAVLVIVVSGSDSSKESPNEVLAAASDFVADAKSVEYTGKLETEVTDPAVGGGGFVDRATFEDAALFPDRGQSHLEFTGYVSESIYVKDDVYVREAEESGDLEDEQFGQLDPDRAAGASALPQETFLFDRPQELGEVLDEARRPRILRDDDEGTLLRVRFDPDDLFPIGFEPYDEATGTLLIDSDHRLQTVKVKASGPDSRLETSIDIERWNGQVKIEAPDEDELDPTPFIEEEDVAAYTDTPLFQPRAIPEDWVLDYADIISEEVAPEGCEQVNVGYVDPENELAGYLDVYIFPTSCAFGAPGGSDELVAGPYRGWIDGDPTSEEGLSAELDVNGTTIQAYTDLSREHLTAILSDLVPFDLANPPTPTLPLD